MNKTSLLCALCAVPMLVQANEKPNIIFILVDDLGKEWFDVYGGKDMILENINDLSRESMVFNRAYSMPQSTPSRVALMTGQYPYNNGWVNHYDVPRWGHGANFDPDMNPCFPQLVNQQGYETCVVGKWQLNDFRLQPNIMKKIGFDNHCMWTGYEAGLPESGSRYWDPYINTKDGSRVYEGEFGPDIFNNYVLDFLTENKDKPMFVYYPMALTHGPLVHTPYDMDADTPYEKFRAMVGYMDVLVGRVVQKLKDLGIYDNTYLFFTTDNGSSGSVVPRGDYFIAGGKTCLSENGINAPFIVKVPDSSKGQISNALVDFTDVGSTVLDLIGAKDKIDPRCDGVSFAPVLRGESKGERKWSLAMGSHPALLDDDLRVMNTFEFRDRVIIGLEYKIFLSTEREIERIYKIVEDPFELNNLVDDKAVFDEVSADFKAYIDALPEKDQNPKYTKIADNKGDVNPKTFNKPVEIRSNFRGVSSKEAYENFKEKKD